MVSELTHDGVDVRDVQVGVFAGDESVSRNYDHIDAVDGDGHVGLLAVSLDADRG
jgi:hypothetical protein